MLSALENTPKCSHCSHYIMKRTKRKGLTCDKWPKSDKIHPIFMFVQQTPASK